MPPLALLTRPCTVVTGYSATSHSTAFQIWEFPGFCRGAMKLAATFHGRKRSTFGQMV